MRDFLATLPLWNRMMTTLGDDAPLKRLLDGWTYLFIAVNVIELGFLLLSGGRYLTMCGANRWFGVWQITAAGLLVAVVIWAFRLRRKHPGRAATVLALNPIFWGLSLGLIIDVMAWVS